MFYAAQIRLSYRFICMKNGLAFKVMYSSAKLRATLPVLSEVECLYFVVLGGGHAQLNSPLSVHIVDWLSLTMALTMVMHRCSTKM